MASLTDKQLAGHQGRSLRAIREKLLEMSGQWDERDQFNMNRLEELADACTEVAADLRGDDGPTSAEQD